MRHRARSFIGTIVTLAFVIVYALGVMVLAESDAVREAPVALRGIFYAALGLAWILPIMPLVRWMVAPDEKA